MSYQPGYPDPAAWQPPTAQQPPTAPLPPVYQPPAYQPPTAPVPAYQPPTAPMPTVVVPTPASAPVATGPGFGSPQPSVDGGGAGTARGLRRLGLALMLAGVLGGVANYFLTRSAHVDSIKGLGFVVPGNATDVEFLEEGRYTLYYFWKGEFETEIDGDTQTVTLDGPTSPVPVNAELLDEDDDEIAIRRLDSDPPSYKGGGFEGIAFRRVQIDEPGNYTLTVEARDADDKDFAIGVGHELLRKPSIVWPLLIALAGLGLGGLCVALSSRRPKPSGAGGAGGGFAVAASPAAPPAAVLWQPAQWPTEPQVPPAAAPTSVPGTSGVDAWGSSGAWSPGTSPATLPSTVPTIQPASDPVATTWSAPPVAPPASQEPAPQERPVQNPAAQPSGWNPPPPN